MVDPMEYSAPDVLQDGMILFRKCVICHRLVLDQGSKQRAECSLSDLERAAFQIFFDSPFEGSPYCRSGWHAQTSLTVCYMMTPKNAYT